MTQGNRVLLEKLIETNKSSAGKEFPSILCKTVFYLPRLKQPVTCRYPQPDKSSIP
jgi:hypothetical protein